MQLTIKQEKFARKYVVCGNASEAYRNAYKAEKMGRAIIAKEACLLLQHPNVTAMVEKIRAQQSDFQAITFEEIAVGLRRATEGATAAGQHSAAAQSLVALGKLAGLYVEKQRVIVDNASEHLDAVQTLANEPEEAEELSKKVVNIR